MKVEILTPKKEEGISINDLPVVQPARLVKDYRCTSGLFVPAGTVVEKTRVGDLIAYGEFHHWFAATLEELCRKGMRVEILPKGTVIQLTVE